MTVENAFISATLMIGLAEREKARRKFGSDLCRTRVTISRLFVQPFELANWKRPERNSLVAAL
jgi:hypothetical protein